LLSSDFSTSTWTISEAAVGKLAGIHVAERAADGEEIPFLEFVAVHALRVLVL
jgi:hypothetical protein